MDTRKYSNKQEEKIAKMFGGKVQSNSGGTKFGGGDVHTEKFLIEAKTSTTDKNSFSIKREWIEKAKEQAYEQGKENYMVAFQFSPDGDTYFVIDSYTARILLEFMEG